MRRHETAHARRPARTQAAARRRRVRKRDRRVSRFALLALVALVAAVTLALTAFGSSSRDTTAPLKPAPAVRLLPAGSPPPTVIAKLGELRLQLPVPASRLTAIGFHAAGNGTLALQPVGRQGNEGFLARLGRRLFGGGDGGPVWYGIGGGEGPHTGGLDVGAPAGTAVYAPVDGRIVGVTPYIVDGRAFGDRIDVQPARAPSVVVSLMHVEAPRSLSVGSMVTASQTILGTVADLSSVERQALARYTNDAGNHVAISVRPAATLTLS
jgi:murein DD-endopeptidase MepM/ murein hydrolase activator NlpD